MVLRNLSILILVAVACLAVLGRAAPATPVAPLADPAAVADKPFTVDVAHSMLIYRVRHLEAGYFYGRVIKPAGSFYIDEADPSRSSIDVVAEIKNMDTGNDGRDRFLKGPDFFNVREYPTARFKSTSVRKAADGAYEAIGAFTMRGVTKPVTARIADYSTAQTQRFGFRGGFEATFVVRRSDFGMNLFLDDGTLGDEVKIIAAIGGAQQPDG